MAGEEKNEAGVPGAGSSRDKQPVRHPRARLGEILVEEGVITQGQLDEALKKRDETGGFLGQSLLELGYLNQGQLVSFLVRQCKIPHISLLDYEVNADLFELVPKELCEQYHLLPIDKLGRILTIAMVDPLDIEALESVRTACPDLRIKPILCDWSHFEVVAQRLMGMKTDSHEVSASSLGLGSKAAGPRPLAADKQAPAPAKAGKQTPASEKSASPPQGPQSRRAAIDAAVDAVIKEAAWAKTDEMDSDTARARPPVRAAGPARSTHRPTPQKTRPSGLQPLGGGHDIDDWSKALSDGVRSAIEQALKPVVDSHQEGSADLAQAVREGVEKVFEGMLPGLIENAVSGAEGPAAGVAQSSPDVAAKLKESVNQAVAEAMAKLVPGGTRPTGPAKTLAAERDAGAGGDEPDRPDNLELFPKRGPAGRGGGETRISKPELDALEALDGPGTRTRSDERVRAALASEAPLEEYSFDAYSPGKANAFAMKVSKAVAANPGGEFNPLFLHGDVGLGKTHLINAIGNAILSNNPDMRVGYVSASRFARHALDALEKRALDALREHYCHWDVLILDDVQFLAERPEVQEELLHIFDALHLEGRQIIIAANKAPDHLEGIEKGLMSRFAGGIVAGLEPPEHDARMDILRLQVERGDVNVSDEVLSLLATRIPDDMRKMSGSLRKVVAFASLVGQDITCELATEVLAHLGIVDAA